MPPPVTYGGYGGYANGNTGNDGYGGATPAIWSQSFDGGIPPHMTSQQAKQYAAIAIEQGGGPYLQQLEYAAKAGDVEAETWLGDYNLYEWRNTESPSYQPKAFKWCSAAATRGLRMAEYDLALLYKFGWGTPANETLYKHYMHLAAQAGSASASIALKQGVMMENTGTNIIVEPGHPTATAVAERAPAVNYAPVVPVATGVPPQTAANQAQPVVKTKNVTAANSTAMLRVPSGKSSFNASFYTGRPKVMVPNSISTYLLDAQAHRLYVFCRPGQYPVNADNNAKRGLFILDTRTGRIEKHFTGVQRVPRTKIYGHCLFVQTAGALQQDRSSLEVLDTRNSQFHAIKIGKGVAFPWSGQNLNNLNWVSWVALGWGPHHRFFYIDCDNAYFGKHPWSYYYFTLALRKKGVTVLNWTYPWVSHEGGRWTLFGGEANKKRIYIRDGYDEILSNRTRRIILFQGVGLVRAATGKVLATYNGNSAIALSPNGKQLFTPYKIPGVPSRFLAIRQNPTQKMLQVIPVGHFTRSFSQYFWTPDGRQILITTPDLYNPKPNNHWGITFANVENGRITHTIPVTNPVATKFSDDGRYAFVLNCGTKTGTYLLCIDLHNDRVVYKSLLPGSFTNVQMYRITPSPGKLVFVAVGHTLFEVNASSGRILGKLVAMDPYIGHSIFSKNGRRIYLATYDKAIKCASGVVAISTSSGGIVRKFALPDVRVYGPPSGGDGGDGDFFGF
jgi:TPR repeat protein